MRYASLLCLGLLMMFQSGCGKNSDDTVSDPSYSDSATASQQEALFAIENGASSSEGVPPTTTVNSNSKLHALFSAPKPLSTCPATFAACSGGVSSVSFNSCTQTDSAGDTITADGAISATFTFTSGGAADNSGCTSVTQSQALLPDGDTVAISPDLTATLTTAPLFPILAGMKFKRNFTPGTAWDGTTFATASAGLQVARSGTNRTLSFDGLHEQILSPHGATWADFVVSSNVTVSGTLAAGTRAVANGGTVTTWHNVLKYKVVHTAGADGGGNPITWTNPSCCHPTEGKLTSVYTGSITGTSTLIFENSSCGAAQFTDVNGSTSSITLDSCN